MGAAVAEKPAKKRPRRPNRPLPHHPTAPIEEDPGPSEDFLIAFESVKDPNDPYWRDIYTDMLKESLPLFARDILGMEVSPHLMDWGEAVNERSRLAILAARDHGKCSPGDTLVLREDGTRVRIDEWQGGNVLAMDDRGKLVPHHSPASQPNGVREILRITTRTGRAIEVTHEHPLRKFGGWEKAIDLAIGDRIAVPRVLPVEGGGEVKCPWLLGLLVGDGGLTGRSSIRINISFPETLNAALAESTGQGWTLTLTKGSGGHDYLLGQKWQRENSPLEWTRLHGLQGKGSWDKRVPEAVFTATNECVADFLAGYFDADGTVNIHGGGMCDYSSVSRALLKDVQHLLLRFGIVAVLSPKRGKYKGKPHLSWRLIFRGKDILTFAKRIRLRGYKAEQFAELTLYQEAKAECSGAAIDRFPPEVWDMVEHSRNWFSERRLTRPDRGYAPTRSKVERVALAEDNQQLLDVARSDVLWDEIVEIESIGEQETWALTVPGLENYVADDVVSHNSAFFSYAYPIWRAWSEPGVEVYLFSRTLEQAQDLLDIVVYGKNNLQGLIDLKHLKHLFPTKDDLRTNPRTRLNKADVVLTNGSRIRAVGYGKAIRGRHPKYCVMDDVLNDEDMWSETQRNKNISYFQSAIINMIMPSKQHDGWFEGGQGIVVGTPYHMADLYAWLKDNEVWEFMRYPGILTDPETGDERALFPWRWNLDQLRHKKKEIGSVAFSREILCLPITDDISMFPSYMFPPLYDKQLCLQPTREQIKERGWEVYFGVDIARSASVGADYFVIFALAKDRHGQRYIVDIHRSKGLPFREQLETLALMAQRYDPSLVLIESNAMQQIYTDEMRRMTDIPVKEFVTLATNKYPLDRGVPGLRIVLENKKLTIPRGDEYSRAITTIWQSEANQFGYVEGKLQGIGIHDDTVMAWWFAEEAIKLGGFSFAFGDEEGEANDGFDFDDDGEDPDDVLLGDEEERGGQRLFDPTV